MAGPRAELMEWYRPRLAAYPWRSNPPDPYRVLVSEVMLQQTQAARVAPAFTAFVARFATVGALGDASRADVLRAWSGLGYNRRALALHEAARTVGRDHGGAVPSDTAALVRLPGVGPYTAAAVASIAYGVPQPALDTNARRVVARVLFGREPSAVTRPALQDAARNWLDRKDPGGWNQAVMDLGREVCRPTPRCDQCPLRRRCSFVGARRRERPGGRAKRFEGSTRQVRGAVMRALLDRSPATLGQLARGTGFPLDRVLIAVNGLARDGLVGATRAALDGRPSGQVRLPE